MGFVQFRDSGLTSALPINYGPYNSYRWRLIWAQIQLQTGTTAGTRSLGLYATSGNLGVGYAELCNTNSQTTVSTKYTSNFAGVVPSSVNPDVTDVVNNSQPVIIDGNNPLQLLAQIVDGDNYTVAFVFEELFA